MSSFWSWFVALFSIANILACWWLLRWTAKPRPGEAASGESTGHTWDGDLQELNNPLPRWWLWMFYITIVFGLVYLLLFPGLGNFQGLLGWSQENQYQAEVERADARFGPIFANLAAQPIPELAKNEEAMQIGQRLYSNYCSQCHGSNAKGALGFPNLADNDWLYGGEPEQIKTSILAGRRAAMPALGAVLGEDLDNVVSYVMSLSGAVSADSGLAGKEKYDQLCAACHGVDGAGNHALGAPNLADDIWLYGGSRGMITQTIMNGRNGIMPAHEEFLGNDKVHVLSAYVYSLSQN